MPLHKLLRLLMSRFFCLGVVEGEGGGAATVEEDPEAGDGADDTGDGGDEGADDAGDTDGEGEGEGDDTGSEGGETDEGDEGAEDGVVVTIGDESPEGGGEEDKAAPQWIKDLRKSNREKDRQLRERDAEIARLKGGTGGQPAAVVVGEKPTFESCGFDADKFEADLNAWNERKRQADEQKRTAEEAEKKARDAWQATLDTYGKAKAALKVKDFDDAEEVVKDTLSVTQQAIIVNGAKRPALVVYALGKNPKKAKELASIGDPVKFAFAVATLETQLKVTTRKAAPAPDGKVKSTIPGAAAVDAPLAKLREEAAKTGDYSKVHKYKQDQRAKMQQKQRAA